MLQAAAMEFMAAPPQPTCTQAEPRAALQSGFHVTNRR